MHRMTLISVRIGVYSLKGLFSTLFKFRFYTFRQSRDTICLGYPKNSMIHNHQYTKLWLNNIPRNSLNNGFVFYYCDIAKIATNGRNCVTEVESLSDIFVSANVRATSVPLPTAMFTNTSLEMFSLCELCTRPAQSVIKRNKGSRQNMFLVQLPMKFNNGHKVNITRQSK